MPALVRSNFQQQDVACLLQVLAGILHIGNIKIVGDGSAKGILQGESQEALQTAAAFCGFKAVDLELVLTQSAALALYNTEEAHKMRDSLSKALFERLFHWLIDTVNGSFTLSDELPSEGVAWLGILDIFGPYPINIHIPD